MDLSTNKSASPPLETNDSEKDIFETDSDGILADQSLREAPDLPNNPILAEKLWLKYRSERDTECDQKLAVELMHRTSLNVYELSALLSVGRWRTILRNGTILIREGEPIHYLCMILSGTLSVYKGEGEQARELHIIKSGDLVGSVEFMDSEREHIAGETVVAREPCTYMEWECDELRHFLAFRTHLRAQLMTLLARDLSAKFRQVEQSLSVS
jgi:CRP-like cAMP-binding protein